MNKKKASYKLIGFYENFNNSGKIKLRLANLDISLCCDLEDVKIMSKYLSKVDNEYIKQLSQFRN
jgi:hypothetical protein